MLKNVRLETSKKPKRWPVRSVYELICDHCGLEFEKSYTNNKVFTSKHFCSRKCKHDSQSNGLMRQTVQNPFTRDDVKEKIRLTNLQRYGVANPSQLDEIKQKTAETWLHRYGVDAPMKSEIIREKSKKTCIEKYGVPNVAQNEEIKQKIINTNIEKYGASCSFVFAADQIKQTNFLKYGVENPMQSSQIQQSRIEKCRNKYGVDHHVQIKKVYEKIVKNSRSNHEAGHIDTPWGIFWYRSSWEKKFLEWCVSTNAVVIDANIMILYCYEEKNKIYYADFLIYHNNQRFLCEIKPASLASLEINCLKFDAAKKWCETQHLN